MLLQQRQRAAMQALVTQVRIHADRITIDLAAAAIADMLQLELAADAPASINLMTIATLTRSGRAMRLVQDNGAAVQTAANPSPVRLLVKARRWWKLLGEGELDIKQLAARKGVQASYVTRVVRLAFLSPTVVEALLKGKLCNGIDAAALTLGEGVPACWREQASLRLPVSATH